MEVFRRSVKDGGREMRSGKMMSIMPTMMTVQSNSANALPTDTARTSPMTFLAVVAVQMNGAFCAK